MKLTMIIRQKTGMKVFRLEMGRIGAMVYGGTKKEILALNEDTLWSGYPEKTQKKLPEGYLEK